VLVGGSCNQVDDSIVLTRFGLSRSVQTSLVVALRTRQDGLHHIGPLKCSTSKTPAKEADLQLHFIDARGRLPD
jgi:hypothetical protein